MSEFDETEVADATARAAKPAGFDGAAAFADSTADLADDAFSALDLKPKLSLEEEIIAKSSANHDPLPMLDVIFGRLVTGMSPMLKSQNSLISEVVRHELDYFSWGSAIERLDVNGASAVVISSWGGPVVVAVNADFLHAVVETLFGGQPRANMAPKRQPTQVERAVAERLLDQVLADLAGHFSRITEVSFKLEAIESSAQLTSLLSGSSLSAVGEIDLQFGPVTGRLSLIMPMETLEPARPQLGKMFLGEKLGADTGWRDHFGNTIAGSIMPISVELHRVSMPLADILGWKPGTELDLGVTLDHEATVICSGLPILHGATGRKRNGKLALRVTREGGEAGREDNDELITD